MRAGAWLLVVAAAALPSCEHGGDPRRSDVLARERDELSALWSLYRYTHVQEGRVVAHDEGGITTSEGQAYAMLRAVWANDRPTFEAVWRWTRENLQVREDRLLAWKWKDRVLDRNAATDADQDAALALVLAARRFGEPRWLEEARALLRDIWAKEVVVAAGRPIPTAGNWAPAERWPTVHVAYLAPYAYEVFAEVDPGRPWADLVRTTYDILRFLYVDRALALPPEIVFVDRRTGKIALDRPGGSGPAASGYDAVPIFWRVALDARWFGRRGEADLRERMLRFPREAFRAEGRLRDRSTAGGRALSELDGLPHLASIQALASVADPALAAEMRAGGLEALFERALAGGETPYYLHNWLWFGRALEIGAARRYDEPLSFLLLLDWGGFRDRFPAGAVAAGIALALLSRRLAWARAALVALSLLVSLRYLAWRAAETLNFVEPLGLAISLALLAAEAYAFSTVALLAVQVGVRRARPAPPHPLAPGEHPSVDVLVPIYSESLEILERTLAACAALRWPRATVHVCDDSHREEVARLADRYGARYLRGPKRHAKAGNLNAALARTSGDLVVVFDTDHVPRAAFLERTVPHFRDARMGVVQTPHHFYNPDVFQRAFRTGPAVPNEADLFNHAIQGARAGWGGAFFVGSGAVFRRAALEDVGGFHLLSITEDIHTSQKLHAKGWRSAFVDEDLAAGLSAETFQGYLVQRRRWMLGCLQIFFRDNPLLERGLPLRHRIGYFASLWFFFFPLARVAFFLTPLWYLLFHLHPLFADLPVLLAYLVPHLVLAPLAASALVPGWPRLLWGTLYETAVAFPLARATLDLVLPSRLAFKVTPKGVTSARRRFDLASARLTVAAAAIGAAAIAKGAFELVAFGIETEAYAFNLFWAALNLVAVLAALAVAWERPQRRADERIRRGVAVRLEGGIAAETVDLSTTGAGLRLAAAATLPAEVEIAFEGDESLRLRARLVWHERVGSSLRAGVAFEGIGAEERAALVRIAFSADGAHAGEHDRRARTQLGMALQLAVGIVRAFLPLRPRRRRAPRRVALAPLSLVTPAGRRRALRVDASPGGVGLLLLGRAPFPAGAIPIVAADGVVWMRAAHARRLVPGLWRVGLALLAPAVPIARSDAYLAA